MFVYILAMQYVVISFNEIIEYSIYYHSLHKPESSELLILFPGNQNNTSLSEFNYVVVTI